MYFSSRITEDLDLFIRATPENIEKLRSALRVAYEGDPNINETSSADLRGEYPAVRYVPPTGDLYFDVMTRLREVASFETIDAEIVWFCVNPQLSRSSFWFDKPILPPPRTRSSRCDAVFCWIGLR